ncbi:BLUF domain-containing protein [Limnohabitans sp. Rim11]|jgi:hypothetical protein|uniref:BLUF domain-containing protein n=1 Tax=Limnohabitans sp. Rim11 TaxID=1100719 RepID=UPI000102C8C8|nr:BLUF domain-containing protein [Limnohabitans sp. Rim11]
MLIRLLYISRATGAITTTVTGSILESARVHNRVAGITGVLCQGQGLFIQVLEGERSTVNRLYNTIIKDKRHQDVELVAIDEIQERKFPNWSMAHVIISESDPIIQLKHPEFDPFEASGAQLSSLIDDLLKLSTPIN